MKRIENFDDYRALVDEMKVYDDNYFQLNMQSISDERYDELYFALQEYEEAHPDEVLKDSSTQHCYSENGNGKRTVARRTVCLSMKKLHDAKAVVKAVVSLHGDVIVCVDGKVEDNPVVEEEPVVEEPIVEEEPLVIDEEPLVIDKLGIVHHPEPHVIEPKINQGSEPEAEPIPQPKPKRKRYYPQVGEPTLREERERAEGSSAEDEGLSVKTVLASVLAVLLAVSTGVVMLAFAGAAVLFFPMMGGLRE